MIMHLKKKNVESKLYWTNKVQQNAQKSKIFFAKRAKQSSSQVVATKNLLEQKSSHRGTRTHDHKIKSLALYQLS
jgi:hypothetical protein